MTTDSRPRLAAHARRRLDPITQRPLLLYPEGALELDEISGTILDRCDGVATLGEIASVLASTYDGDPDEIARDVATCLGEFAARGLVVFHDSKGETP